MTPESPRLRSWKSTCSAISGLLQAVASLCLVYYAGRTENGQKHLEDAVKSQVPKIEEALKSVADGSRELGKRVSVLEKVKWGGDANVTMVDEYVERLRDRYPEQKSALNEYLTGVENWRSVRTGAADLVAGKSPSRPPVPPFLNREEKELLDSLAETSRTRTLLIGSKAPLPRSIISDPITAQLAVKESSFFENVWNLVARYPVIVLILVAVIVLNFLTKL
jgi:hypothetical protein